MGQSSAHVSVPLTGVAPGIVAPPAATSQDSPFLKLPAETRSTIYRMLFVEKLPIDFDDPENLKRSSQLLSTCREIHDEGRKILYGANIYAFKRSNKKEFRPNQPIERPVGFRNIRAFLNTIGASNVREINFVELFLTDIRSVSNMTLQDHEKRFVIDPVVREILQILGRFTVLEKLSVLLQSRRKIRKDDYVFLRALASVKTCILFHVKKYEGYKPGEDKEGIVEFVEGFMKVDVTNPSVDVARRAETLPKLTCEPEARFQYVPSRTNLCVTVN